MAGLGLFFHLSVRKRKEGTDGKGRKGKEERLQCAMGVGKMVEVVSVVMIVE